MKNLNDDLFNVVNVIKTKLYVNGQETLDLNTTITDNDDAYYLYYQTNKVKVISLANGYALTLPYKDDLKLDLFATIYRVRYLTDDYTLTVSMEHSNTYDNWKVYHDEWIMRYLTINSGNAGQKDIDSYFKANKLSYIEKPYFDYEILKDYEVEFVSVEILEHENIEKPYYYIAIVRKKDALKDFTMLVLKAKTLMNQEFKEIVSSLILFEKKGTLKKPLKFKLEVPSYLSDETKKYYEKLRNQNHIDFGIFIHSMQINGSNSQAIIDKTKVFENSMDYKFDIMPTYTHTRFYEDPTSFPTKTALTLAGGNGFNGLPVLQFTLQFTTSNNEGLHGYTPMFDILRGKYDNYFKTLAADMKAYKKPILFRVNNEMNSDWVSYCGQVTLLDPDIFVMTYERMAKILRDEGCDNLLYIFNPTGKTYPYCSWGEDLCYLPSLEFVQILGLTYYEYNNYLHDEKPLSFKELYDDFLYNKNSPMWLDYPAIISEFACGAGGEFPSGQLYRNATSQALWVQDMFKLFNDPKPLDFIKQIKGAIWFNANDYYNYQIKNLLVLDSKENALTIKEFKKGLREHLKKR